MNKEVWKDILGFEGHYQVSNLGRVKSIKFRTERILKPANNGYGYLFVKLCKNGEQKKFKVHRLLCQAFLPNPNNLPDVNHKDENPSNNRVENLEWCDCKYNNNYGSHNQKVFEKTTNGKLSKPVLQYTKDGIFVKEWKSTHDVERILEYAHSYISACCLGKRKSANGFVWKYKN